jgi:hypothetical protein
VKDLNFTLITTIQTAHNADKLDALAGQARNDSGYGHPWIGIETSIEQVIADDVLGNQCDKGSDHRLERRRKMPGKKTRDAMFPPHIFFFPPD